MNLKDISNLVGLANLTKIRKAQVQLAAPCNKLTDKIRVQGKWAVSLNIFLKTNQMIST